MESTHPHFVHHRRLKSPHSGFTLIELLVVLGIISVLTTVVVTGQGSFNKSFILTNTAYSIALSLRSAESYGIGGRAAGAVTNAGYGIHFQKADTGTFTFFADSNAPSSGGCHSGSSFAVDSPDVKNGNCVYEPIEKIVAYTLGNGITIADFCAYQSDGSLSCASGTLSSLDIVFIRPNPDPFVRVNGNGSGSPSYTKACIVVTSAQGGFRYIWVDASGQIIIKPTSCI